MPTKWYYCSLESDQKGLSSSCMKVYQSFQRKKHRDLEKGRVKSIDKNKHEGKRKDYKWKKKATA